jgi:hypothetical protein
VAELVAELVAEATPAAWERVAQGPRMDQEQGKMRNLPFRFADVYTLRAYPTAYIP